MVTATYAALSLLCDGVEEQNYISLFHVLNVKKMILMEEPVKSGNKEQNGDLPGSKFLLYFETISTVRYCLPP